MWAKDDGYIYFKGRVVDGNYFGLGFGAQMDGSDMVVFFGRDGEKPAYAEDFMAPGYKSVSKDGQQDYEQFGETTCQGRECFVMVRRKMDTGDYDDYKFASFGSVPIIWAYDDSTNLGYHKARGFW
jgi:hypothetical protein